MNRNHLIFAASGIIMVVTASLLSPTLAIDSESWPDRFDHHFKKQSKRYFGIGFDWRWFKAQGIVESNLQTDARSPRGALGVMQILPSTFDEVFEESALVPGILEPRWNIAAGIAYDRYLYDRWDGLVENGEKLRFSLASYNAGFRRIAEAGNSAGSIDRWQQVAPHTPPETRNYVKKIIALMQKPG